MVLFHWKRKVFLSEEEEKDAAQAKTTGVHYNILFLITNIWIELKCPSIQENLNKYDSS